MGKPNKKGRSKGAFVMLHNFLTDSPAWLALSGNEVKLLTHLMKLSKGNNGWGHRSEPGELFLGERDAAVAIGVSRNTASKAFQGLIDRGFLRVVQAGHFQVKIRTSTVWRLTFEPYPKANIGPTNDWRDYRAEQKSRAQKLTSTGAKTAHISASEPLTGAKIDPVKSGNGAKLRNCVGSIIAPHIDMPLGVAVHRTSAGWWGADWAFRSAAVPLSLVAATVPRNASNLIRFPSRPLCEHCDGPFTPQGRGMPQRFCSETCRRRAEKRRALERKRESSARSAHA